MKPLVVILVAALGIAVGADSHAHSHRTVRTVKKHGANRRAHTRAPADSHPRDELVLSPSLMRQLQRNLVDGGYYSGAVDGRLTRRTRAALLDFQREYHLAGHGDLNRATAEALLGRDAVAAAAPRGRG